MRGRERGGSGSGKGEEGDRIKVTGREKARVTERKSEREMCPYKRGDGRSETKMRAAKV